jgi:hypothetical protein
VGRKYRGVDSLEGLIEVVLIHELAHLITHRVYDLKYTNEDDSVHVWEYTAQCATYVYLKIHCERDLKAFEQLSRHQPFVYRTWESLKALKSVYAEKRIAELVKSVFSPLRELIDQRGTLGDNENYDR